MPGLIVQQRTAVTSAGVTTVSDTITGVVAGNHIIAHVGCDSSGGAITLSGVSDGTAYAVGDPLRLDAGNNQFGQVFYLENAGSGSHTVVATATGGTPGNMIIRLFEVSGLLTSSSLDKNFGQLQSAPGIGANGVSSGATAATTQANDFVIGLTQNTGEAFPGTSTITAGTGYTKSGTDNYMAAESKSVTATGAQTATFTQSVATARVSHVLAFKEITTPSGGVTLSQPRQYPTSPGIGPVLSAFFGSTTNPTVLTIGVLTGAPVGTDLAAALLTGTGALAGSALGTSIAQAALTGTGALSGAPLGTGIAQSLLTGSGQLAGSALGTAIVQGLAADSGSIVATSGAAIGTDIAQGLLTATGTLAGAPMGSGLAQALLTGSATLSGAAIGTSIVQSLLIDSAALSSIPGAALGTSIVQGLLGTFVPDATTATPGRQERLNLRAQIRAETDEEKRQRRIRQGILPNPADVAKAERLAQEAHQRDIEAKLSLENAAKLREITATIRKLQANAYRAKREAGRLRDKALALEQARAADQQIVVLLQQINQLEMEQRIAETMIEELDIVFVAVMLAVS